MWIWVIPTLSPYPSCKIIVFPIFCVPYVDNRPYNFHTMVIRPIHFPSHVCLITTFINAPLVWTHEYPTDVKMSGIAGYCIPITFAWFTNVQSLELVNLLQSAHAITILNPSHDNVLTPNGKVHLFYKFIVIILFIRRQGLNLQNLSQVFLDIETF